MLGAFSGAGGGGGGAQYSIQIPLPAEWHFVSFFSTYIENHVMKQVVTFFWVCGLYIGLSYLLALVVATFDQRRPIREQQEVDPLSRKERDVDSQQKWCLGLESSPSEGGPVVVGLEKTPWLQQALQHATGVRVAAAQEAKDLSRYSKSVLVIQPPEITNLADWNRLFMTWALDFKGPMIAVLESKLAADPKGELTRVLQFLGQKSTGVECALKSLPAPEATDANASLQNGEVKDAWDTVLNALHETSPQL